MATIALATKPSLLGIDTLYLRSQFSIYAPPWRLSTLAKEFTAATRMIQSSSNELSILVSGKV